MSLKELSMFVIKPQSSTELAPKPSLFVSQYIKCSSQQQQTFSLVPQNGISKIKIIGFA